MSGRLESALEQATGIEVAMDDVQFLYFGNRGLTSIGTANLNGCSAIMIVSIYGAIIAHIPPRPNCQSQDPEAGDRHVRTKMQEVTTLYNKVKRYFPAGGSSCVVCATFQGEVALPDQQRIIQECLDGLGFANSHVTYKAGARRAAFSGQGTVFVDGRGQVPMVYVEDTNISAAAKWSSSSYRVSSSRYLADSSIQDQAQYSPTYPTEYSALYSPRQRGSDAQSASSSEEEDKASAHVTTESYYYVRDNQYFLSESEETILLPGCPKNVWVFNEKGWALNRSAKWRLWDGKSVQYG